MVYKTTVRSFLIMARITAKDIAAKLGISPAAVSLALNGRPGVSENTRAMVLEAAMQMGYARQAGASGSRQPRTLCFVRYAGNVVSVAEHTSFSSFVLQGIEARATELGYSTQVRYLTAKDVYAPQNLDFIRQADGILLLGTDITAAQLSKIELFLQAMDDIPVVIIDNILLANRVDCIVNDCFGGARAAVEHFIKTGHQKIGYIRANHRLHNFQERERGILAALEESGRQLAVAIDVDISSEGAFQDFDAWIKKHTDLPDAFFAENDIIAAAAIRVLKKHGYHVPGDVSIIGFDDIPTCEMLDPPLSTVHCFKEEMGAVAVDMLHRRIRHKEVPHSMANTALIATTLSTRFISRFSVKKK